MTDFTNPYKDIGHHARREVREVLADLPGEQEFKDFVTEMMVMTYVRGATFMEEVLKRRSK